MRVLPKRSRRSKKVEVSPSKPVQEKKSTKSPKKKQNEELVVSKPLEKPVEPESIDPTKEFFSFYGSQATCYTTGLVIRDVPIPISSSTKKHQEEYMAKRISKKQQKKLQ
ncbi:unnamed protein product [Lactuca saligna]|uniref:Uncharacterized protein n=1 Tax=Lactuca saligna TaxID=75948 RepID=A0AA35ZFB4_LACSI|nr:unnamed protein product [Lactuca saligna]